MTSTVGGGNVPIMPRRVILQATNSKYASMAAVTSPAMRAWAEQNEWDYVFEQLPEGHNPYRSRYAIIRDMLGRYESVMWLDADIAPRSNRDIVYQQNKPVCASVDYNGWCAGATIWANCREAEWIMEGIIQGTPNRGLECDQAAMKAIFALPWMASCVGAIPQTEISNPCSNIPYPPVMSHWWSNHQFEKSLVQLKVWCDEYMNQIGSMTMSSSGIVAMQHSQS